MPPSSSGSPEAGALTDASRDKGADTGYGIARQVLRDFVRLLVLLMLLGGAAFLLFFLTTRVHSPVARWFIAALIALSVGRFAFGFFKQATQPSPPEPAPEEVPTGLTLTYVCEVCGTELAVVKLAQHKPPKHCGEEMVLFVD